mgnify:FL=1
MEYTRLGNSGLEVSKLCLGCMGFGDASKWSRGSWILNEEESMKIIKRALELGINFFDTADMYSLGESERILGKAIKKYANRNDVVIATKIFYPLRDGKNNKGLSRKYIFEAVEASLKRLDMDYIDLLVIHRFDYDTPLEETMEALHDLIKMGKIRYIGASAMYAWQFQKANYIAEKHGWTKFISMQNHYNLLYREDERELIPYCIDSGIQLTPYSPLASGRLSRSSHEQSKRFEEDKVTQDKYINTLKEDNRIIDRVGKIADRKGITRVQVALAWLLSHNYVASPLIGATKISHLEGAISALDVKLTQEEINYLEEEYIPHKIVGAI